MLCNHTDDTCNEDYFQVTLMTAAGFDTLKCGCRPWIRRVPVCVYNFVNTIIDLFIVSEQFLIIDN